MVQLARVRVDEGSKLLGTSRDITGDRNRFHWPLNQDFVESLPHFFLASESRRGGGAKTREIPRVPLTTRGERHTLWRGCQVARKRPRAASSTKRDSQSRRKETRQTADHPAGSQPSPARRPVARARRRERRRKQRGAERGFRRERAGRVGRRT